MKKPPLSLAISAPLALLQANLLPALSEPASPSIWQQLAGVNASQSAVKTGSPKVKSAPHAMTRSSVAKKSTSVASSKNGSGIASGAINGHAMLFLSGKNKEAGGVSAPAAALTIHPALPVDQPTATASAPVREKPTLVAMNGEIPTDLAAAPATAPAVPVVPPVPVASAPSSSSKQLLAQLAPDQIVAQGEQTTATTASPIPPVVSGTIDLEEFKTSNVIDLKVSQSRTFKLKNKIVRTSISDPAIAEPVVVAENQLVLLGKSPGGSTLVLWDDAGNSIAIDIRVNRDYSSLQSTLREIDPRIIVKPFSVGGSDRVLLLGDVDHPESVIRAFSAANAFMDDRGMKILAANSRLLDVKIGEQGQQAASAQGGQTGQLAQLSQVDKYVYFANTNNNVGKAQSMVSDGGRVTSLIRVRKTPLIVLHCAFMEMNTASVRELGVQLGVNFTSQSFGFGLGGSSSAGTGLPGAGLLTSSPGINGTQGSVNSTLSTGIAGGTAIFNGGIVPGTGITPPGGVFIPPVAGIAGFQPGNAANAGFLKGNTFGATSSPVSFSAANVIPSLLGATVINTPLSGIGQALFPIADAALLGQTILLGSPGGATFTPTAGLANLFTGISNFTKNQSNRWSINPSIQGTITHSRSRVLAEPTLVTISGERASFLAGGEIPIFQAIATAGAALQSVVFEPFGLRLNMIPVLLENGNINLQVSPEERILSAAQSLTLAGSSPISSFTTRKAQTIVELKPGQELYISGLVSSNAGRQLNKTPIIGEIPVLGALYRSKAFAKNESELVISVRPEIILPGTPGQLKLPEEISRVEGPRDTNILQVEPTVIDERYTNSGRSEHYQKIPGILPAGAPIPDSQ